MKKLLLIGLAITSQVLNAQVWQVCFDSTSYQNIDYNFTHTLACADFNKDGKIDIASTGIPSGGLYINYGNGDGTFAQIVKADTCTAKFIMPADFNNDGKVDLGYAWNGVYAALGDGAGAFPSMQTLMGPFAPEFQDVCHGDFNGDSKMDLAVGNHESAPSLATMYLNAGNGTFGVAQYVGGTHPARHEAINSGDFNGDGKADLAVAGYHYSNYPDSVFILLGNGNGTFAPRKTYLVGRSPSCICVRDLNADGFDDLAVMNSYSSSISILWSQGSAGTFSTTTLAVPGSVSFSVVSDDFNGDGILDLAANMYGGNSVAIILGKPNSTFDTPIFVPTGVDSYQIATADFNADGKPDLATANLYTGITVLLNCTAVGIKDNNSVGESLQLYPNPATDLLTVRSSSELGRINIYNIMGEERITLKSDLKLQEIDVSQLPKGIYEVRYHGRSERFIKE